MSNRRNHPDSAREVHLDDLLGREVLAANNQPVGRLEEFRAKRNRDALTIDEYVIGASGLFERLGVAVALIFGSSMGGGYVANWDQLDISDPKQPRLTCDVGDLQKR